MFYLCFVSFPKHKTKSTVCFVFDTKKQAGALTNSRSMFDPELDNSQQGLPLLLKKTKLIDETSNQSQLGKRSRSRMNETDNENENEKEKNEIEMETRSNNKTEEIFDELPPKAKQRTNEKGHWRRKKMSLVF